MAQHSRIRGIALKTVLWVSLDGGRSPNCHAEQITGLAAERRSVSRNATFPANKSSSRDVREPRVSESGFQGPVGLLKVRGWPSTVIAGKVTRQSSEAAEDQMARDQFSISLLERCIPAANPRDDSTILPFKGLDKWQS